MSSFPFRVNMTYCSAAEISVSVLGRVVLAGPLQGRVVPSMCMWALLPALRDSDVAEESDCTTIEGTARLRHHRIQLSLEKGTVLLFRICHIQILCV